MQDEHGCNWGEDGPGESEKTVWVKKYDPEEEYDSLEDLLEGEEEYLQEEFEDSESSDYVEFRDDYVADNWCETQLIRRWRHVGMFLTETDADNHLKHNYYHYSKNAHTYVDHAWRAYAMEEFFNSLFLYFDVHKKEKIKEGK